MMTVGARLRQARHDQKLSLTEVTERTKIQPWVLEALEANRLHGIMSPVYVKGFLASYARFLHLEPEPLIAQLPWPASLEVEKTPLPTPPRLPWPVLRRAGLIALGAAGLVVRLLANPFRGWLGPSSGSRPKLASVAPIAEPVPVSKPPTLSLKPAQPLELSIIAHRATWVQVRADGKLMTQQRLQRGADERWTAARRFELIIAKPSQVDVILNGQSISPFAVAHQGRLVITRRGISQLAAERP